jgi:ferredoxin
MPKITVANEKVELEVAPETNLRKEVMKNGVQVYQGMERFVHCMGLGLCGTCQIKVKDGMENLSQKTLIEKITLSRLMSSIGNENELRLSCQCTVKGDCTIQTRPDFNWNGENFWQKPYPNK